MLYDSYLIYKLFLEIAKKLKLECLEEYSFKLTKGDFNNKRFIYILYNRREENIIYDNMSYIKKELNIVRLPKFEKGFIKELIYGFDLERGIYKIYITILDKKSGLETIYGDEYVENKIISRMYYEKKIKKNMVKKYNFLKKYKEYISFRNFDNYYEREKENKMDSIHLVYNIDVKVYDLKELIIKICDKLKWDKKRVVDFLDKMRNTNYYVNIIGLSEDNINLYFNKKIH